MKVIGRTVVYTRQIIKMIDLIEIRGKINRG